jgi:hypothetical protein
MSKNELYNPKASVTSKTTDEFEIDELIEELENGNRVTIPMDRLLSDDVSANEIQKCFNRIIRKGDYYPLETAKGMIRSKRFHRKKEERLIDTLDLITIRRGIAKAKEGLKDKKLEEFKRSLRELGDIKINPVTIPREWGIKKIPNLLDAYYDKISEEQAEKHRKQQNDEIMQDYSSKKKKKKRKKEPVKFLQDSLNNKN